MFNRLANNELRLGRAAPSSFALMCRIVRFFLSFSSEFRQFGSWHEVWVLDEYTWRLTLASWFKCSRKRDDFRAMLALFHVVKAQFTGSMLKFGFDTFLEHYILRPSSVSAVEVLDGTRKVIGLRTAVK
ncbi:hypothetical protein OIU79_006911 [Salix purpurea]|uniref:Uncharacterized protein n=1 Tax=Salix purpurea TaxID=77065 RepID=A0A9Q0Z2P9_SALPP|nr:hypothetical protein OIU79_006911 [Salix purpurea]